MKSALDEVVGLYENLLKDLSIFHPSITKELSRDLSRLREAGLSSGLPVYTIALPEGAKFLRQCFETGYIIDPRPPLLGAKSKVDKRPKLFHGLWALIFDADGTFKSERPHMQEAVMSLMQLYLAVKKLDFPCEDRYVNKAISDFREIEDNLPRSWDSTWDCDNPVWCRRDGHPIWGAITVDSDQTSLFEHSTPMLPTGFDPNWRGFRDFVARFSAELGNLHPFEVRPKHGPGAVSDKSSYTKYDGFYWTNRLESVFPYDWFGAPNSEFLDYVMYVEYPSRLMAVPKSQAGPRLIACEPTCHQWIQGGIQRWLEEAVKKSILADSIDFRDQSVSQALALEASENGRFSTIDLKSASDRLTTRLVEYCFQGNRSLLDALHACRTRYVEVSPGEQILLRKFSTQGSACTFPVQTIVFALLSVWAVGLTRGRVDYNSLAGFAKEVRVFGDDIIVPADSYTVITSLLTTCMLKVNTSKSFTHGKFRESCGMDAYDGVDVTPAYFRQLKGPKPTSMVSIVECSNNFHKKGYWHTAAYIASMVDPQELRKLLIKSIDKTVDPNEETLKALCEAPIDSGLFGLASFCGRSTAHLRERWNTLLHRTEVQILTVSAKIRRIRGRGHGDLLQFFVEDPASDIPHIYEGGQFAGAKHRKGLAWVALG